jgi:KipI family sensor histidine kinase inhibitor
LYYHLQQELDYAQWQIIDIVPSYTALAIYFKPDVTNLVKRLELDKLIEQLWNSSLTNNFQRETHIIPTNYNGEDLESLAAQHQLEIKQLIALHTAPRYLIAMLGFKPYFPYLIGLDSQLITPRRSVPRINTPKGSVAIGGTQTGIYTENSPGGWHIIGHTEFEDYQKFKPGDYLLFKDINSC